MVVGPKWRVISRAMASADRASLFSVRRLQRGTGHRFCSAMKVGRFAPRPLFPWPRGRRCRRTDRCRRSRLHSKDLVAPRWPINADGSNTRYPLHADKCHDRKRNAPFCGSGQSTVGRGIYKYHFTPRPSGLVPGGRRPAGQRCSSRSAAARSRTPSRHVRFWYASMISLPVANHTLSRSLMWAMARSRYLIRNGCPEIIGCSGTPMTRGCRLLSA